MINATLISLVMTYLWPPASSTFSIIFIGRLMGGDACGAIFLDLSKTFDTVDQKVLLLKLRHLGFKASVVSWFCSYLSNRQQCTRVNSSLSEVWQMSSGVPQVSILGPLLFISYINDLPGALTFSQSFIYADDTALLVKGPWYCIYWEWFIVWILQCLQMVWGEQVVCK